MTKSTAVATVEEAKLPVSAAQQAQWAEDAGQGLEEIGAKDIAIPFLGHVQSQSKQLLEGDPRFLEEAKVGTIFNTVTGECFSPKEGITVIPVDVKKAVFEKEPKLEGGKNVAVYNTQAEALASKQRGNELLDGYRLLVLYQTKDGAWAPAALSMGTKSKVYTMRNWNALMSGLRVPGPNGTKIQPPTFAWTYKLTSAMMEFNEGTAAVLKATAVGPAPDDAYAQAKNLRKALAAGTVTISKEEEPAAATQAEDDLPY